MIYFIFEKGPSSKSKKIHSLKVWEGRTKLIICIQNGFCHRLFSKPESL